MADLVWRLEGEFFHEVKEDVMAFWASVREKYADGITLGEVWELAAEAVDVIGKILAKLDAPNDVKRKLLLELIDETYKQVIAPLDIEFIPNIFEPFVDRLIGELVRSSAEKALEYLFPSSTGG